MQQQNEFPSINTAGFEEIGGEPEAGSGFEAEDPEKEFQDHEPTHSELRGVCGGIADMSR